MEISIIKDTFDHVIKKQKLSSFKSLELVDQVSNEVEQALANIQSRDDQKVFVDQKAILIDLRDKLNAISPVDQLEWSHKELAAILGKYPKLLEKFFHPDISKANRNVDFDFHLLNQILATHFYRLGLFDIGDCLINETGESETIALRSQFFEMHQILEAIKVRNLQPALHWASTNREKLKHSGSELELKFQCLQFVEILKGGTQADALNYAKSHLAPLASYHMKGFQKLFVNILWRGKLESCPYSELLAPTNWDKLCEEFIQTFCHLLGQSYNSPLTVALSAGVEGLPTLLKLANVMAAKQQEWEAMKHLPVPVDLGKEFQFHSIFVCPITRDQSSDENPPMLMPCQHVICKQSIMKLSKGTSRTFKCPYCPSEASIAQCRQIYL